MLVQYDSLKAVSSAVNVCTKCKLSNNRQNPVAGEGWEYARIMFIGEGPGEEEDKQGRPFVGKSGTLLDKLIQSVGILRSDVFITNTVKCRPPQNREPLSEEIAACRPYLEIQIKLISPLLIVTLGNPALRFFETGKSITNERGRLRTVKILDDKYQLLPTFHPAAVLRDPRKQTLIESDFSQISEIVRQEITKKMEISMKNFESQSKSAPIQIEQRTLLPDFVPMQEDFPIVTEDEPEDDLAARSSNNKEQFSLF